MSEFFAKNLGAAIGLPNVDEPYTNTFRLHANGEKERGIYVTRNKHKEGRYEFSAIYPGQVTNGWRWSRPRDMESVSITCAASKPLDTIARDIKRRLLPFVEAQWLAYIAARDAHAAALVAHRALVRKVAACLDACVSDRDTHYQETECRTSFRFPRYVHGNNEALSGECSISYDHVRIDRLTFRDAETAKLFAAQVASFFALDKARF